MPHHLRCFSTPPKLLLCLAMICGWCLLSPPPAAAQKTIPAGTTPVAIATNIATNKIYTVNQASDSLTVVDGALNSTTTISLPGQGPVALAINPTTNRIYVANYTGNSVWVLDGKDDSIAAKIPLLAGSLPMAIAVNPVTDMVYVPASGRGEVAVIDGASNTVLQRVPTDDSPRAVAINPVTNRIYVANFFGNSVTVIEGADNSSRKIPVGNSPSTIVVNPITNKVFVVNFGSHNISVINGATESAPPPVVTLATFPNSLAVNPATDTVYVTVNNGTVAVLNGSLTGPAAITKVITTTAVTEDPYPVAVNVLTNQVFVGNRLSNTVSIIDGVTNTLIRSAATGTTPKALALDVLTNTVYTANRGSNTVTRLNANELVLFYTAMAATQIAAGASPQMVDVNPVTNKIYVADAAAGAVTVINGGTNATATVQVGSNPRAVAVNPLTDKVYVGNRNSSTVSVISGNNNAVAAPIPVGTTPNALAVALQKNKVYVVNTGSNDVSVIDAAAGTVSSTISVGAGPLAAALDEVANRLYVVNEADNSVSIVDTQTDTVVTTLTGIGTSPRFVAVNTVTHKAYVTGFGSNAVYVISNGAVAKSVSVLSTPGSIAINELTNTIYVGQFSGASFSIIDGSSDVVTGTRPVGVTPSLLRVDPAHNTLFIGGAGGAAFVYSPTSDTVTSLTLGGGSVVNGLAINPVTDKVYVSVATGVTAGVRVFVQQPARAVPLTTTITPFTGNTSPSTAPSFTFTVASTYSPTTPPVRSLYYQLDTREGPWKLATPVSGSAGTWSAQVSGLRPGLHVLYGFASDGQEYPSDQQNDGSGAPVGAVAAYLFFVKNGPTVTSITPPNGTSGGGTAVTIGGSNFVTGASVTIGGVAATSVTVTSPTSITAMTAPQSTAAAAAVVVTNPDGQAGTLSNAFTFLAPTISSVGPQTGPATGGTRITITGTNFAPGTTVAIGGTAATQVSVLSSTSIVARTPAGAPASTRVPNGTLGPASVTVTNAGGVSTTGQGFIYNCAFTVSPLEVKMPAGGGNVNLNVTTQQNANCGWTASSGSSFAVLTSVPPVTVGSGTVTLSVAPSVHPSQPRTALVSLAGSTVTVSQAPTVSQKPFGVLEFGQGPGKLSGSFAITGWALDDQGIARVHIWRDAVGAEAGPIVFVGDAVRVEGARPDVAAVFPDFPEKTRAGWGYLLLSNVLPSTGQGLGNGKYTFHVFADDVEGNRIELGAKTLEFDNASSRQPFGAIDTPSQGQTISGTFINFGWALTPISSSIAPSGATISVFIDGAKVGSPTYNQYRSDIAGAFPGLANSNGAVGFFSVDTTQLADGIHTIAWTVVDAAGRAEGIGSRFFYVSNGSALKRGVTVAPAASTAIAALAARRPLDVFTQSAAAEPAQVWPGDDGVYRVEMDALDLLRVRFETDGTGDTLEGRSLDADGAAGLPPGSELNSAAGMFTWQAAPGLKGDYRLLFTRRDAAGNMVEQFTLVVTVKP